jgi:hypothetical protein
MGDKMSAKSRFEFQLDKDLNDQFADACKSVNMSKSQVAVVLLRLATEYIRDQCDGVWYPPTLSKKADGVGFPHPARAARTLPMVAEEKTSYRTRK